jgi:hypothetical protein
MALPEFQGPEPTDSGDWSLKKINALLWAQNGRPSVGDGGGLGSDQSSTVSTSTPITADGQVLNLAVGEKGFIQNLDDAAVYVKYGTGASSSSFNFVLAAGSAANDGLGGSKEINDWIGVVSIAAATGSPRVIAWKLS